MNSQAALLLMRVGVDTGGTFTDCVFFKEGKVRILKVFSRPDDPARAILEGVRQLVGERLSAEPLDIIHGTTFGTNSVLERRGARVALVTTAGFEDLVEIGRQARPRLYDLNVRRDAPLVPPSLRFGALERTAADGKILRRPSLTECRRLRARVERAGADSVAVCLLFSFANTQNERRLARALRPLGLPISVSHEILPEFREYERLSTVVINAYLAPRLGGYLARLERGAREELILPKVRHARRVRSREEARRGTDGVGRRILVMQSSGGIMTAARAAREPVRTILSGPAGGVVATAWLAESLGVRRVVSFDMGGTSTDVCLLDGPARTTRESSLAGLPLAVPVLDVHSVGTGGGSVARIDRGGALRVGPESAGAVPGPICYGRGGTEPTVTDANLLLGRLDPDYFLGGAFRLDARGVERRFEEFLRRLNKHVTGRTRSFKTPLDLAQGIVSVSNATMEKALRVISVERGHDPRDFALVCFGGAGGLHAADLAHSLGLARVIVPRNPGGFSALGVLLSDIVKDVSQSVMLRIPVAHPARPLRNSAAPQHRRLLDTLKSKFAALEKTARRDLGRDGFAAGPGSATWSLDARYVGQSYELTLPFTTDFQNRFHQEYEKVYGYAHPERPLEIVNLRVRVVIRTRKPPTRLGTPATSADLRAALVGKKPVWFFGQFKATPFYDRERLPPGARVAGPAVIVEYSSTTVTPPGWTLTVDRLLNLQLREGDEINV